MLSNIFCILIGFVAGATVDHYFGQQIGTFLADKFRKAVSKLNDRLSK